MPLNKSIDLSNTGSPASYWVVTNISIDFVAQTASVSVSGYGSSADYSGGLNPLASTVINVSGAGNPLTATNMANALTNLYNDLLNYPMFSGATVVS